MRQIKNNPSERSMLMGWQLLRFLCQASPPRADLMEFVEAFASAALASGVTGVPDERFLIAAGIDETDWQNYTVDVGREAADCIDALSRPQSWILASAPNASTVALQCKEPNFNYNDGRHDDDYEYNYGQPPRGRQNFEVEMPGSFDDNGQRGPKKLAGSCVDKCCSTM